MKNLLKIIILFAVSINILLANNKANTWHYLSGDWSGLRNSLEKTGLVLDSRYLLETWYLPPKANNDKSVFLIHNIDIDFLFDFEKLFGLKGARLLFDLQGMHSDSPNSDYLGSLQGISNIETWNNFLIYEFWYQQNFANDKLSLLFGLFDLNSEFDVSPSKANFITPSHGIGTDFALSGLTGPSIFPLTSLAFRAKYKFTPEHSVSFAVFDGMPGDTNNLQGTHIVLNNTDGLLIVGEADAFHSGEQSFVKLGFWYYTDRFSHIVSGIKQWGIYGIGEMQLLSEMQAKEQGLSASVRLGYSPPSSNLTSIFLGASLEYKGLFSGRDDDYCGIAFAYSSLTDYFHRVYSGNDFKSHDFDSNIELFYKFQLSEFIFLQPVLSYFNSPALNPKYNQYIVGGLRLHLQI